MMYICLACWTKYYKTRLAWTRRTTNLCEVCNQYKELDYLFDSMTPKNKKKWPVLARRKLKRMFVWSQIPKGLFDDETVLEQPAKDVIKAIAKLIRDAENVGYTNIRFESRGDYDGSWYEAHGVRPETDIEMRRRFKQIRRHKKTKKKK